MHFLQRNRLICKKNTTSVLFAFVVIVIWLPLLNAASIDAFNAFRISSALFVPP